MSVIVRRLLIVLLLLALPLSMVMAQDTEEPTEEPTGEEPLVFELVGVVSFDEDGGLLVNGVPVMLPEDVELELEDGQFLQLSGMIDDDGLFTAETATVITEDEAKALLCDGEGDGDCIPNLLGEVEHPIAAALSEAFELDYELVESWNSADSLGYGNIGKAILLADALEEDPESIIARVLEGENPVAIAREAGLSPSILAPGQVISGRMFQGDDDDTDDGEEVEVSEGTAPNQGQVFEGETNNFGCEGRGNSCNTPANNNGNNGNNGGGNGNSGNNGGGNGKNK